MRRGPQAGPKSEVEFIYDPAQALAQGGRDRQAGAAEGGQEPAQEARDRREHQAVDEDVGRDAEGKATSLKLGVWPDAVVKPLIGNARRQPRSPPARAGSADSTTNENRMLRREKPMARSVLISRVRAATIALHGVEGAEDRAQAT